MMETITKTQTIKLLGDANTIDGCVKMLMGLGYTFNRPIIRNEVFIIINHEGRQLPVFIVGGDKRTNKGQRSSAVGRLIRNECPSDIKQFVVMFLSTHCKKLTFCFVCAVSKPKVRCTIRDINTTRPHFTHVNVVEKLRPISNETRSISDIWFDAFNALDGDILSETPSLL